MSDVPAEDLHNHNPVVTHAGRLEVSCEIDRDPVDRRIAADAVGLEIKVHGLGNMDAGYTLGGKVNDNAAGIIPAAYDQRIYAEFLETFLDPFVLVRVCDLADLDPASGLPLTLQATPQSGSLSRHSDGQPHPYQRGYRGLHSRSG